jgi:hypothetical protein
MRGDEDAALQRTVEVDQPRVPVILQEAPGVRRRGTLPADEHGVEPVERLDVLVDQHAEQAGPPAVERETVPRRRRHLRHDHAGPERHPGCTRRRAWPCRDARTRRPWGCRCRVVGYGRPRGHRPRAAHGGDHQARVQPVTSPSRRPCGAAVFIAEYSAPRSRRRVPRTALIHDGSGRWLPGTAARRMRTDRESCRPGETLDVSIPRSSGVAHVTSDRRQAAGVNSYASCPSSSANLRTSTDRRRSSHRGRIR